MTKREFLDIVFGLAPTEANAIMDAYWIPDDWMFSEVWQSKNMTDYPEDETGCNLCDMAMKANDFCSRAERREVTT